ncbi:MAG TPA: RNA degradosome polyphosphate kinase, partial [Allosphingosinicella sp.]
MDSPVAPAKIDASPAAPPPSAQSLYFNRELSWLAFNRRVLEEACNPAHPLLERLRFLSISGDNLDEFFMVRVAGLKGQQLENVEERSVDGLTPSQQLTAIARAADALTASQQDVWSALKAQLRDAGVTVLGADEISGEEGAWLDRHFADHIYPIITPQAIDPAHPFPFIPNKGFSLIFDLERDSDGEPIQELVMVPGTMPRFIRLPGELDRYVAVETLIRRQIATLFPGYRLTGGGAFRVIRDSDIEVEEEAEDLVRFFRTAIKRRRRGRVIRLKLEAGMPEHLVALVCEGLNAGDALTYESTGFLGIGDLAMLVEADRPDLKFVPFAPRFPERIREFGGDCFAAIKAKDIIVHHPYESFDVVVAFLRQAAD